MPRPPALRDGHGGQVTWEKWPLGSGLSPHLPGSSRTGAAWSRRRLGWPGAGFWVQQAKGRGALGLGQSLSRPPQAWPHGPLPSPSPQARPRAAPALPTLALAHEMPLPHCRKSPLPRSPLPAPFRVLSSSWGLISWGGSFTPLLSWGPLGSACSRVDLITVAPGPGPARNRGPRALWESWE